MTYELYKYIDDEETMEKVGLIIETTKHYSNGAYTQITNVDGDLVLTAYTSDGRPMLHASITGTESVYVSEPVNHNRIAIADMGRAMLAYELWSDLGRI